MTHPAHEEAELVRYLLGELGEAETAAIDASLGDDATWAAMQLAEDDVLEMYAAGALSAAQRDRLRERLAGAERLRDRLALLDGLRLVATRRLAPRRLGRLVATASALALAAGLILFLAIRGAGVPTERAGEVVALALLPPTRSTAQPIVYVQGHPTLALSIVLDAEDDYPHYRVRIRRGRTVAWSSEHAAPQDGALVVRVPVRVLGSATYEAEIEGIDVNGAAIKLGTRGFTVVR